MKHQLRKHFKSIYSQPRDPRYIFVICVAAFVFTMCFLQVRSAGLFDSFERPVFNYFNNLPRGLYDAMLAITQLGGLGSLVVWGAAAWYLINKRAALTLVGTAIPAWFLAKVAKVVAHRGRPHDLITNTHLFSGETFGGYGFPSGHATFSAACATFLYYQVAPRYRKYLLLITLAVGISRMYLGAHFPLDVVGGWALGALIGGVSAMVWGISSKRISVPRLKKFLKTKGLEVQSLTFARVDARGSRPMFITTSEGKEYFAKLFGKQEHAADWLFKIFRFFRYKNLQAEEPHISSRRNVEIEAFAMLWAKQAGVRVASIIDILRYGSYWVSIQEKLDAIPLAGHGHVLQKSLVDAWTQVRILHEANIAHRDLRATNIMIDKKGQAWLIDFGFAEVSATKQRQHMEFGQFILLRHKP